MKEWRQAIVVICTVVLAIVALATFMQFEHAAIRSAMRDEHAQMRGEHAAIRSEMRDEHAQMRDEHAEIRTLMINIDRRTARIEGHLFGIEIPQDPENGE